MFYFVMEYMYNTTMGRKRLNRSKEELDKMNRIRRNRYYENHKNEEQKKSLERYHKRRLNISDGETLFTMSNTHPLKGVGF